MCLCGVLTKNDLKVAIKGKKGPTFHKIIVFQMCINVFVHTI